MELPVEIIEDLDRANELRIEAERQLGYENRYVWDVSINGIKIQLRTNNRELLDLWRDNWHPAMMGDAAIQPHGIVYAVTGVKRTEPRCVYHPESKTAFAVNVDFYGKVRSLALGALLDIVDPREETHFIRGALVDVDGEGIAFLSSTGAGRTTHAFMLLQMERARIHSHEWIFAEHLGGEKGRISTHASERSFFIRSDVTRIHPRLKDLRKRSKQHGDFFLLDPLWIGGRNKAIDTTRIKVAFILVPENGQKDVVVRMGAEEALELMRSHSEPFFNPHMAVRTPERIELQAEFIKELLDFVAVYKVNSSLPVLDVHAKIRGVITKEEYVRKPIRAREPRKAGAVKIMPRLDHSAVRNMVETMRNTPNVQHLPPHLVRRMAEPFGSRTKFGNYNFVSTVKNRSAGLTVVAGSEKVAQATINARQRELIQNLPKTLKAIEAYLHRAPFLCVERTMGQNDEFAPRCTLYQSVHREEMVRLAHMVSQTLFSLDESKPGAHFQLVYIPEWQEKDRQILVFPESGITFVLGTDYYGEAKKGFLRMAMWEAKQRGMLGLHAGAKIIRARGKDGTLKTFGMLLFGLTATGKTTHTCHNHGLSGEGQGINILQDDVVFMKKDGAILGTEKGFYIKTDSLDPEFQPILYNAATRPDAIFENVLVDYLGEVDFKDEVLTGNGRCIIQRTDLDEHLAESVNLPPLEDLDGLIMAFITRRNTVVPLASKLTPLQAAGAFMLGESIETSGSDPRRAGESVREVGTNPFIVGDKAQEANIFLEIIQGLTERFPEKIHCYLLNTGGMGEIRDVEPDGTRILRRKVKRVEIPEMAAIIHAIATDTAEWVEDPWFGTLGPKKIPGMNIKKYDPLKFYDQSEIEKMVAHLRTERREYLEQFPTLDPAIKEMV
jgi:phosphoenolpyruvate carboxykinase (ATP)